MKTETLSLAGYEGALDCASCPQSNGPKGCPVWLEVVSTEFQTGNTVIKKGCGFQMIPMFLMDIAKIEDTRAGEVSAMKEAVVDRVTEASLLYLEKQRDKKESISGKSN